MTPGDTSPSPSRPTDEQIGIVVERLTGQCILDLEAAMEEEGLDFDDQDTVDRIEEHVFLCAGCGWWCSTDELNNETQEDLCDECDEKDDEDGDD